MTEVFSLWDELSAEVFCSGYTDRSMKLYPCILDRERRFPGDILSFITGNQLLNIIVLENKMVSAFFPMKKDGVGAEGSGL